jgi:hypothetical protein
MELTGTLSLALAAISSVLLLMVTGGVVYLTLADWRDRRRRMNDQKSR